MQNKLYSIEHIKRDYISHTGHREFFDSDLISKIYNKLINKDSHVYYVTQTKFNYLIKGNFYTIWKYDSVRKKMRNHSAIAEYDNLRQVVKALGDL